jgi:alkylation response protein AidB-like acyl-CoA dehydrogenase
LGALAGDRARLNVFQINANPSRNSMIERTLFSPDHEAFRDSFRRFIDKEIAPFHEAWEEQGYVDRAVWNKAGENGFLCATMPEAYGGADADKLYSVVQFEELSRAGSPASVTACTARSSRPTSCTTARRSRSRSTCPNWPPAR